MEYLFMVVYGLWWGFLRRWYGGCFGKYPFFEKQRSSNHSYDAVNVFAFLQF